MKLKEFDSLEVLSFNNSKGEFKKHFHDSYVISLIEKGIFIENNLIGLKGNILISHPFEVHENKIFDNNPYSVISFYVNADVMQYLGSQKNISFPKKLIDNPSIYFLFKQYFMELYSDGLKNNDLLTQGLKQLIFTYGENNHFEFLEMKDSFMPEILDYINQSCHTKIKLDDLATMAKQSKYNFIRQFKKNIGITPFEYINLQRTIKAKRYLREGKSLIETALSTGYFDQSHFNNYFKSYVGLSPKNYINSNILQDI